MLELSDELTTTACLGSARASRAGFGALAEIVEFR